MQKLQDLRLPVYLPGDQHNHREVQGIAYITAGGKMVIAFRDWNDGLRLVQDAEAGKLMCVHIDWKEDSATPAQPG
jgi:hypothetical protein